MAATITFNELERNADTAFAYAILARLAKSYLLCVYRLREIAGPLDGVLGILTPDCVEWLACQTSEDAVRVRFRLQELHRVLAEFSRSAGAVRLGQAPLPMISGLVSRIQDRTEDLGDIVETIALATNSDLKNLVSYCTSELTFEEPEDVVGSMQG